MNGDGHGRKMYDATRRLRETEGLLAFSVDCFGDHIAKREKYRALRGLEAVHFYLVQKHHWPPSQVKSLSWDDLRFLLAEEMHGWTLPKAALHEPAGSDAEGPTTEPLAQSTARRDGAGGPAKGPKRQRVSPLKI